MSDQLHNNPQVILCDMCTEERRPARKTCMKCEISMCVQHLQAHLTTPVLLQTHPLTEPMASGDGGLGTTKCPQHGKLLEYYCLDDRTCVCVSCAIEDQHSKHNMKTFSTAHKLLLEKVKAEQQALQVKTGEESVSLEKWEKSEREKLGRSSVRLIEAMNNLRDVALTSVQSSVSSRMVSIRTSRSSLQAAEKETDTFRFLQMYSQVHQEVEKAKAMDLSKGLEPGSDRDKLVKEIIQKGENIKEQASQFWASLLTYVNPENHQELSETTNTFFEPLNLGKDMSLSKDQKKVFLSGVLENSTLQIQGTKSFTRPNIHRWVISLSSDCDWIVGLWDKNMTAGINSGQKFGLQCRNTDPNSLRGVSATVVDENTSQDNVGRVSLQVISPFDGNDVEPMARLEKMEVIWSDHNSLTFYDLTEQHQRRKIVTVPIISQNQHLTPFVCCEMSRSQNMSIQFGAFGTSAQKEWKCGCGRVNVGSINPGKAFGFSPYNASSQRICPCGRTSVDFRSTEVLCELL